MIYRMFVLFTYCWGSNLSIQDELGKLNEDLLQPSGIRYEVWSFSVRHLIFIAYWKWLISGVKLSVVVPQAIGISLRNIVSRFMTFKMKEFTWPWNAPLWWNKGYIKSWWGSYSPFELPTRNYFFVRVIKHVSILLEWNVKLPCPNYLIMN